MLQWLQLHGFVEPLLKTILKEGANGDGVEKKNHLQHYMVVFHSAQEVLTFSHFHNHWHKVLLLTAFYNL